MNKESVIDKIKHQLKYSELLIKLLMEKGVDRNKVPDEFFEDAIKAHKRVRRLLGKVSVKTRG